MSGRNFQLFNCPRDNSAVTTNPMRLSTIFLQHLPAFPLSDPLQLIHLHRSKWPITDPCEKTRCARCLEPALSSASGGQKRHTAKTKKLRPSREVSPQPARYIDHRDQPFTLVLLLLTTRREICHAYNCR